MQMPPIAASDLNEILAATAPLWQEMRGQRLFVTGGTGFFGCWLVESFLHINRALSLGATLTVLTRNPEAFLNKVPHLRGEPSLSLVLGDVRDFVYIEPHGYVIHAATDASARQLAEEPLQMLSTLLAGTERVLRFAAAAGTRKLLLTSSGAVYGPQPEDTTRMPETYPGAPDPLLRGSVYGEGKRASELLSALAENDLLSIKIARCYAFVGPHLPLDQHFAAGNFLSDALAGRDIAIASDGRSVRSYLYASDLMIWLWTILFQGPSMRAYNVGSEDAVSIRELAEVIRTQINPEIKINVAKPASSGIPVARYVPSTLRAQQELGLSQTVPLAEGLRRTAVWHRLKSSQATS